MRILHVLSQTELTGAEVYATSLAEEQIKAGHDVTLVSDRLYVPTLAAVLYQPIANRGWLQRFKNIFYIKKIISENQIDIVHAHSRASSWVSYWATIATRTAFVSTVHGRQHLHFSLKFYDVYGDRVIAICDNIRKHLIQEVHVKEDKISVIPNGFEFDPLDSPEIATFPARNIFLVGRTSGPKGERTAYIIRNILPELMEKYSDATVTIAGGPLSNFDNETIHALNGLKKKYGARIHAREYVSRELITQLIRKSSLVVGTGRLGIQALSAGRALLAIGEAFCHGIVTEQNLYKNISSNFGDILSDCEEDVDYETLASDMYYFLEKPFRITDRLVEDIRKYYTIGQVYKKVDAVYFEALLEKRAAGRIPVLMYHKIVNDSYSSKHKTYITEERFSDHIQMLENNGFTSITFKDVQDAALLNKQLPAKPVIITFDDGYKNTVKKALPILQRYGHRAVFYLLGSAEMKNNTWDALDGESALLSNEEILDLQSAGMELGAHSVTHRKLSELPDQELHFEVLEGKKYLEKIIEKEIISFAYPYGNLCERTKEAVREHGFRFAVATDSGGMKLAEDPFQIFRVSIFPQDTATRVRKKASRFYRFYYFLTRRK